MRATTLMTLAAALTFAGCNTTKTDPMADVQRENLALRDENARLLAERDRERDSHKAALGKLQQALEDLTRSRVRNSDLEDELGRTLQANETARANWQRELERLRQSSTAFTTSSDIDVDQTPEGNIRMTLPNEILFQSGSEVIGERGRRALDEVVQILNERFPSSKVEIAGHTDTDPIVKAKARGFDTNMKLSLARANSVHAYLSQGGLVGMDRVRATGYGEHQPRVPEVSPETKRQNRRVEVIIFKD